MKYNLRWSSWCALGALVATFCHGSESAAATDCSSFPQWAAGSYSGGAQVQNRGVAYQCKSWPFNGWCGSPGYEPGVTSSWQDAWIELDVCSGSEEITGDPLAEITGQCAGNPAACCPEAYDPVVLDQAANTYQTGTGRKCVVGLEGSDVIAAQGGNHVVIAGPGDDTFQAASGDNLVVPGPGIDTVATGTGDDTVFIFDLCELGWGETIDTGSGNDTLVAPLPLAELQARGLNIANVENVVVQQNSCRSECVVQPECFGRGQCAEGAEPGQVECRCVTGASGEHCEVANVLDDRNECTTDACDANGSCTHTPDPLRVGIRCSGGDCIGLCSAAGNCECEPVDPAPEGAPLRILTANIAALPNTPLAVTELGFSDCHTNWSGAADYECMARKHAEKILASNYDVVVLNEAFDEGYQDEILDRLHGSAADGRFPYVIRKLDATGFDVYNDSGLMLFSKWPFDQRVPGEEECFDISYELHAEGVEYEDVPVPSVDNEVMTYRRVKSAVGFRPFDGGDNESDFDTLSNKGVGFARLVAPTGIKYDVFFSHLQASYGEDDYDQWFHRIENRRNQLAIASELMTCLHQLGGAETLVLAGDLNVDGDVSNPFFDPDDEGSLDADEGTEEKRRNNNRAEWDFFFNTNSGGRPFFKTTVLDSWAYGMSKPECNPGFGAPVSDDCAPGAGPGADLPFKGLVTYDRGFTWGDQTSEIRLDYILLGSSGTRDADHPFGQFGPQHVTKAYNMFEGYQFEGGITMPSVDGVTPKLGGGQILSDHIGLNGEIDYATPHSNPATAFRIEAPAEGYLPMRLERRGVAQWFRIDEPGSYTFSVSPANHLPPGPSSELTYRVYTADELSKPLVPFKGELITVPPSRYCYGDSAPEFRDCYTMPGYREAKFKAVNTPLFVKVYHASSDYSPDYTGEYLFMWKRATCTSQGEACDLVPYESQTATVSALAPQIWFAFHVDKPDASFQDLRLFVTEGEGQPADYIFSVEVMDADGNPALTTTGAPIVLTRNTLPDGTGEWSLVDSGGQLERQADSLFGAKFFLKITRAPARINELEITARMTTNLTWLYGPDLGGAPGHVFCNNTQEVGDDEIWMMGLPNGAGVGFPSNASGAELSGGIDEDESEEWTGPLLTYYRLPSAGSRPKAALFTESFKVRFWEDDSEHDEKADRTFAALGEVVGTQSAPSGWWNFPKEALINDGENYKGRGPTLSHYYEGRLCRDDADCDEAFACSGSRCVQRSE